MVCVLSGGGAKSAAHVGALKALGEWGLSPGHLVGTSMGAVIGACFAAGLSYDEVLVRVAGVARGDVARIAPFGVISPFASHFLRAGPLLQTIANLVPARRFSELRVPLTVTATDLETGQLTLFGSGGSDAPLIEALYASCALPVFYPPGRIDGRLYADGGLRAVLPLDVAELFDPDLIFAVNVGPVFAAQPAGDPVFPAMVRAHDNSTRILMAQQVAETIQRSRDSSVPLILVEPEVLPGTFAVGKAFGYIEAGYRAASRKLSDWSRAGTTV